jgi:hypothetical protein
VNHNPTVGGKQSPDDALLSVPTDRAVERNQWRVKRAESVSGFFVTDDELATWKPAPELVEGLISSGEVNMLFAPKNRGKTFLGLHLAYSIATGQPDFLGCRIRREGSVVYSCAEGKGGLVRRRAAWRQAHGYSESIPSLGFVRDAWDIRNDEDVTAIIEQTTEHFPGCVLFVIDTLSQHMPGGDEGTSDMSAALHGCQRIRDELGVTVLAIHHPTKSDERNERGGSGFRGGCADVLNVEDDRGVFVLKTQNARDRGKDTEVPYTLKVVTLDDYREEDGRPLTSCVVRRVNDSIESARRRHKDDDMDRAVLAALASQPLIRTALVKKIEKRNKDVGDCLARLQQVGRITKDRKGRWSLLQ